MDQEQRAIDLCEKNHDQTFFWEGEEGKFEIVEDCNCCGATNQVLFCFQGETKRRMLSADQLVEAIERAKKAD